MSTPKIKTSTGIVLDAGYGMAPILTKYSREKGLTNVRIFYDEELSSYLLAIDEIPEYVSQLAEDIACHIDSLAITKDRNINAGDKR